MERGGVGDLLNLLFPAVVIVMLVLAYARRHRRDGAIVDEPASKPYRVYTRCFDLDIDARDVPAKLRSNTLLRTRGWLLADASLWERKVAAARQQLVDPDSRSEGALREALASGVAADWAICFLVDQSGSMKDDPIRAVAATLRWCSAILTQAGVKVAILGHSTLGWHGGEAATQWVAAGRPKRPGRLAALLHIRYQYFDGPLDDERWAVMLHPDILRENIDGEALQWAGDLLDARPEPNKVLIVLSDGAPVDDATLMHNGPSYLWRHLKAAIAEREAKPHAKLAAIGLNYRVDELYTRSRAATNPADLPEALADLIIDVVGGASEKLKL